MEIVITIKETKDGSIANIKADFSLSFESVKDAENWVEYCKSDIERMEIECDCPKCRAEKEAEKAKPEPEVKPEEPKPNWTPEVGMLIYMPKTFGHEGIYEITNVDDGWFSFSIGVTSDYFVRQHISNSNCKPIAELEGLEEGSDVFCVSSDGRIETFKIDSKVLSLYGVKLGDTWFRVNMDGKPKMFGNGKQMFWRTKERAERFGK